jgi:glycosyltransferase involved in cell wall biosynthesis
MRLGINGIRLLGNRSGVGRAIEAMLRWLGELEHPFSEIRVYTPEPLAADVYLPPSAKSIVHPSSLPFGLWEQLVLPIVHRGDDLLLCPSYVAPIFARGPILLVHHGSYEGYPQTSRWWRRQKIRILYTASAHRATHMTTVSEHSKRDIVRYYGVSSDKITVVPEGVDTKLFRPITDTSLLKQWRVDKLGSDSPFIMYVGKPSPRRNLPAVIEAFARIKYSLNLPHKLLLIGMALPGLQIEEAIMQSPVARDIVTIGFASHAELAVAYNAADLLIYPSSYEGFGMPVLEAMACGIPAIALKNTAFLEFANTAALLLPDARVETLADGIAHVLRDVALRRRMGEEGVRRAADYDWSKVVAKYITIMTRLARTDASCALLWLYAFLA